MADIVEDLNALAKEVFSKKPLPDLIPDQTKIQKAIPFSKGEQMGLKFVETVRLAYPSGFTHAKGDGTAGAFTLKDSIAGTQKRAEVSGSQILLRDQLSYEDAAKCKGGEKAFMKGTKFFFEGLQRAMRRRLETQMWYGSSGIGEADSSANSDSTTTVVTFTAASWAPGIWVGNEGMQVQFYDSPTGSNLVSSGDDSVFTVESVNVEERKVTFTGTATGITALDSDLGSANQHAFYNGAKGNEMTGIHGILSNTGELYGISAATYSLWKSASYALPAAGPLSFKGVKKAIGRAVSKGLDEDIDLYMNPKTWDDVLDDIVAMRRTDREDTGKAVIGAEEIVFHSQNGKCRLIPTMYVKEGHAMGICGTGETGFWKRLGAADVTFNAPGFGDDMFIHLQTKAGVESRAYTHQTVFCDAPAKQLIITNIVNSTD